MRKALLLFVLTTFLAFCRKGEYIPPTTIEGKVFNSIDGEEIPDAYIYAEIRMPDWLISQPSKPISTLTDPSGYYKLEIPEGYTFQLVSISKTGFLPSVFPGREHDLHIGGKNMLNVQLIPEDGYILVKSMNDLPGNDSLYVAFFSYIKNSQFMLNGLTFPNDFPVHLNFQDSKQDLLAFPAEEFIQVYWDTKPFVVVENAAFRDSVYVSQHDTASWVLHF